MQTFRSATLLNRDFNTCSFLQNLWNLILRASFFTEHFRWLLLILFSNYKLLSNTAVLYFSKNRCSKWVTHSYRDGWNVRHCSSSLVQVFQDRRSVQIGDGWNVRNWLNTNFLKLVEIWIWIFQNLRCLSC